jgi:FG-GAP repeat
VTPSLWLAWGLLGCNRFEPGVPIVTIEPASPTTEDDLVAVTTAEAGDVDGDPLVYRYQWTRDGVPVDGMRSATVPADQTTKGETWEVHVQARDGEHTGENVVASVDISNALPQAWARISPEAPTTADTLTCQTASIDLDGDELTWSYAWYNDGVLVSRDETIDHSSFDQGDVVYCDALPNDGSENGYPASSASVTLVNGPPIATITFDEESPKTDTLLGASVDVIDPDDDTLYFEHVWLVDGQPLLHGGLSLDGATWFDRDQVVSLAVGARDALGNQSATSASLTVVNSPPETPVLSLDPDPARRDDDLRCVVENSDSADADGDAVNYTFTWTLDDVETTAGSTGTYAGDTVLTTYIDTGDDWACSVVAFDGEEYSAAGEATMDPVGVASLDDANTAAIYGRSEGDGFGTAVAGAGDVNADGFADLLVGAPNVEIGSAALGKAYLFLGPVEGSFDSSYADLEIVGAGTGGELTGGVVAGVGDLNRDGYDDIAVAASGFEVMSGTTEVEDAGVVLVYFGPLSGNVANANADAQIFGTASFDAVARAIVGVGDLTGGVYQDLLIGVPFADGRAPESGATYLLSGPVTGSIPLDQVPLTFAGAEGGDYSGDAADLAGDMNGDGIDDLVIGANGDTEGGTPNAGAAFVFFGPHSAERELRFADAKLVGEAAEDFAGAWLSGDLDLDADGYADLAVGANRESTNGDEAGAVYLVHGPVTGTISLALADSKLLGEAAGDHAGVVVDSIGDIDADGLDDLFVTASLFDSSANDAGAVYIVLGADVESGSNELSVAMSKLLGTANQQYAGASASKAGDVDGDGVPDLLVGAPGDSGGAPGAGAAFLIGGASLY